MKIKILTLMLMTGITLNPQAKDRKYHFEISTNEETTNTGCSIYEDSGIMELRTRFFNTKKGQGEGFAYFIYKYGGKTLFKLAKEMYPNHRDFVSGLFLISDMLYQKKVNPKIDSNLLKDFDIHVVRVSPQYFEKKLSYEGEGGQNGYYVNEEIYPLEIEHYLRTASTDYYTKIASYSAKNSEEQSKIESELRTKIEKIVRSKL